MVTYITLCIHAHCLAYTKKFAKNLIMNGNSPKNFFLRNPRAKLSTQNINIVSEYVPDFFMIYNL